MSAALASGFLVRWLFQAINVNKGLFTFFLYARYNNISLWIKSHFLDISKCNWQTKLTDVQDSKATKTWHLKTSVSYFEKMFCKYTIFLLILEPVRSRILVLVHNIDIYVPLIPKNSSINTDFPSWLLHTKAVTDEKLDGISLRTVRFFKSHSCSGLSLIMTMKYCL